MVTYLYMYTLLKLVVEWTLIRGVARQMEAFKEGFNSVFPLTNMQGLFYPSEVHLCGVKSANAHIMFCSLVPRLHPAFQYCGKAARSLGTSLGSDASGFDIRCGTWSVSVVNTWHSHICSY